MSSLHPESARKGDNRGLIERRSHVVTIKKILHELLEFFLIFFLLIQFQLLLLSSLMRLLLEFHDIPAFDSASAMGLHSHLTSLLILLRALFQLLRQQSLLFATERIQRIIPQPQCVTS